MSDQELVDLRARNAERVEAAKVWMGRRWLLHPSNKSRRFSEEPKVKPIRARRA